MLCMQIIALEKELQQERERAAHVSEQSQKAADALAKAEQKVSPCLPGARLTVSCLPECCHAS